jgi:hypothetical protein
MLHLQARHRLIEQEGQGVVIGVAFGPQVVHLLVLFYCSGIVFHISKVLEPLCFVSMDVSEIVLVYLEYMSKKTE